MFLTWAPLYSVAAHQNNSNQLILFVRLEFTSRRVSMNLFVKFFENFEAVFGWMARSFTKTNVHRWEYNLFEYVYPAH